MSRKSKIDLWRVDDQAKITLENQEQPKALQDHPKSASKASNGAFQDPVLHSLQDFDVSWRRSLDTRNDRQTLQNRSSEASKSTLGGSKILLEGTKIEPRASKSAQDRSKSAQDGFTSAQDSPKFAQVDPKSAPKTPKSASRGSKLSPKDVQEAPS